MLLTLVPCCIKIVLNFRISIKKCQIKIEENIYTKLVLSMLIIIFCIVFYWNRVFRVLYYKRIGFNKFLLYISRYE